MSCRLIVLSTGNEIRRGKYTNSKMAAPVKGRPLLCYYDFPSRFWQNVRSTAASSQRVIPLAGFRLPLS